MPATRFTPYPLLAIAAGLFLQPPFSARSQETVQVGIVLPLTGPQSFFGEMERGSFELALEEINAAGGIDGARLEFVFADDRSRPDDGARAAQRLIDQDRVVMLGGGYSSAVTARVAELAQQARTPFLINTGAADAITENGWEYVFRLNPTSSEYVAAAFDFLSEVVQPRTAAVIYENTAFGQSQSRSFKDACREAGVTVVLEESYSHADFKLWRIIQILMDLKRAKPDVVYMISYVTDASMLMTQARALRWQPKVYFGGGAGFTLPAFYELTQEAAEGVFTVTLWHQSLPYTGAMEYFSKFRERYDREPDYHGAEAYAAAYVIADVLRRAESFDREAVREALLATRVTTPFGPVEFVSDGGKTNQNRLATYVGQWIGGTLRLVWPRDVAQGEYIYPTEPRL